MKLLYLSVLFIICVWPLPAAGVDDLPQCFKFRWILKAKDDEEKCQCDAFKDVRCVEPLNPLGDTIEPPSPYNLWENRNNFKKNDSILCSLTPGIACIKHTVFYNYKVIRTTSYCGKLIENEGSTVSSGCFQQYVNGSVVEACACQSNRGMPCNGATKINYSSMLTILVLLYTLTIFYSFYSSPG